MGAAMKYSHFRSAATVVFPGAKWTGGGPIHASHATTSRINLPVNAAREILHVMMKSDFPTVVTKHLRRMFPGMEWILADEEFATLLYADFYRVLRGQSTVETNLRLRNPVTNSVFHRVALKPDSDFVGGIRFWVEHVDRNKMNVGFRFRLQELSGDKERQQVRERIRAQVEALEAEMIDIKEFVATLPETTKIKLTNYEHF